MSDVPVFQATGLDRRTFLEKLFEELPEEASQRGEELDRRLGRGVQSLLQRYELLGGILDSEVGVGYPDDGTGKPRTANTQLHWVRVVITGGLGGAFSFAHNWNIPPQPVPGRLFNFPNVRWGGVCFTHGDRTGTNGAPAAAANPAHCSVYFRLGDSVTANAIELRVHSNLTVSAAAPLVVEIPFSPAVV